MYTNQCICQIQTEITNTAYKPKLQIEDLVYSMKGQPTEASVPFITALGISLFLFSFNYKLPKLIGNKKLVQDVF